MRAKVSCLLPLLLLAASPGRAQEPDPVRLTASQLADAEVVSLTRAWRYAPGDAPGREAAALDDSGWPPVLPAMAGDGVPGDWPGVGWFRRHLRVDPSLRRRPLALRLETAGAAEVYLDGRPVLAVGRGGGAPPIPSPRREAVLVTLAGPSHVLAVRHLFPLGARAPHEGIGFVVSIADPRQGEEESGDPAWLAGLRGAIVALPVFLAFLHLALFGFDRRARENLFYAVEMASFALIVLREYREDLLPGPASREALGSVGLGVPVVAIFFGLLTYYAVRTNPAPRTWRWFAIGSLVLLVASYAAPSLAGYAWIPLFVAMVVEITRVERGGRTVERRGAGVFLWSLAAFGLTIVLQVLITFGALESVAGVRAVYVFGIVASAIGMSLYLARSFGEARLAEAENERKGHELARARELQLSMLPRVLPEAAGLDLAAASHTATEVGGDFYDLRLEEDGRLLVAFGDATGHGLAAGILVTAAKALFTSLPPGAPLPDLLAGCGRTLSQMGLPRLRMCLALARVSPREASIVSAAMPPVLVHRASTGGVEELGAGALPLGSRAGGSCEERRTALGPGDTLLFATDGFPELRNPAGEELGYGGAARAFRQAAAVPRAADVVALLGEALARFRGALPLEDDVTFLVVRVGAGSGDASTAGSPERRPPLPAASPMSRV